MSVFADLQNVVGTRYNRSQHNKDILDMYFLRLARERGIRLPSGTEPERYKYLGAFVFTPKAGLSHNVMYLDLASLYPNLMRALNVGPDTIIGTQAELDESPYDEEDCVWGYIDTRPVKHLSSDESWANYIDGTYKMVYDPNANVTKWVDEPQYDRCYYLHPDIREGFIPEGVGELLDMKYRYEGSLYEAIKRIVNSCYGTIGYATENNSFRLYDWRVAETITLSGRKVIQYTAHKAREYLADHYDIPLEDTYIAIGDTDGAGLCWPQAPSQALMQEYVGEAVEYINGEGYGSYMPETFGVPSDRHYMEVEIESYAPTLFVPAKHPKGDSDEGVKKRYAQWITWDEGEEVDEVDITGLEAERSDVAPITRDIQEEVLATVVRDGVGAFQHESFPLLRETEEAILDGDISIERVAKRGGIGKQLDEYGTDNRKPRNIIRGAKYMNQHFNTALRQGSKPFTVYLSSPDGLPARTYDAETAEDGQLVDALAVEDPSDLPASIDIDYEKHARKALVEPMRTIVQTLGFSWSEIRNGHEQTDFNQFANV